MMIITLQGHVTRKDDHFINFYQFMFFLIGTSKTGLFSEVEQVIFTDIYFLANDVIVTFSLGEESNYEDG